MGEAKLKPQVPESCPAHELVVRCCRESEERPSFSEVLQLLDEAAVQVGAVSLPRKDSARRETNASTRSVPFAPRSPTDSSSRSTVPVGSVEGSASGFLGGSPKAPDPARRFASRVPSGER